VQSAKRRGRESRCQFQEVVASRAPAQEQVKKAEEAKSKLEGLKTHFTAGNALIDQEKQAKVDLQKRLRTSARRPSRSGRPGDQQSRNSRKPRRAGREGPQRASSVVQVGEAYDTAGRNDDAAQAYQQAIAASRTFLAITTTWATFWHARERSRKPRLRIRRARNLILQTPQPVAHLASACTTQTGWRTRSSRWRKPRSSTQKARKLYLLGASLLMR